MTKLTTAFHLALLAALCGCSSSDDPGLPAVFLSTATPGVIQGGDSNIAWTVMGAGFQTGAAVTVDLAGVTVTNVTVVSATQVTFQLSAPTGTAAGSAMVTVTNPDLTAGSRSVPTVPQVVMLSMSVQPIFSQSCATVGCHTGGIPAAGMNLTSGSAFGSIVGVTSAQVPAMMRVMAGDPDMSYLMDKVEGTQSSGARMPLNGGALGATDLALIRKWIEAGALNN